MNKRVRKAESLDLDKFKPGSKSPTGKATTLKPRRNRLSDKPGRRKASAKSIARWPFMRRKNAGLANEKWA